MKTVGIIGGLGPETTEIFHSQIIKYCQKRKPVKYPRMIINSVPLFDFLKIMEKKNSVINFLTKEIKIIEKEVDFVVIPCNTAHWVIENLRKNCRKEILAIHEEVARKISALNYKRVGLIGTSITINNGFYQKELKKYGVESIIPERRRLKEMDKELLEKVLCGRRSLKFKNLLKKTVREFKDKKAEAVALICTALPLVIKEKESCLPLLSSVHILAKATFKKAME